MPESTKINLLGMSREQLEAFFLENGEKAFRATQVMKWIHQRGVTDFQAMTDISKGLRALLEEKAEIHIPDLVMEQNSADGTSKWAMRLDDGNAIETVFIPEDDRGTLCVSSQVGCALDCTFCSTARQGFNRNLSSAEIIAQVWMARTHLQPDLKENRVISNIVLMGMGEPLLNYDNVITAMDIMLDDNAYGLSKRRVTLSTSGVVPAMDRLADDVDVALAVSLHAPNDELRDQLVPLNRKYPIRELMAACDRYLKDKPYRARITYEYVMLEGINDSPELARQLVKLLKNRAAKVNLIPFNPFPETRYKRSSLAAINRFRDILHRAGIITVTRKTRGDDIDAACGQLAGKVADKSRREIHFSRIEQGIGK